MGKMDTAGTNTHDKYRLRTKEDWIEFASGSSPELLQELLNFVSRYGLELYPLLYEQGKSRKRAHGCRVVMDDEDGDTIIVRQYVVAEGESNNPLDIVIDIIRVFTAIEQETVKWYGFLPLQTLYVTGDLDTLMQEIKKDEDVKESDISETELNDPDNYIQAGFTTSVKINLVDGSYRRFAVSCGIKFDKKGVIVTRVNPSVFYDTSSPLLVKG